MSAVPPELFNQINELKDEFQGAAAIYPWLSLYVPPINKRGAPILGEATASVYASSGDTFGVDWPKDLGRRAAVDHVNQLTWRAHRLLARVLDHDTGIPPDIQEGIRDWEKTKMEYGWIRWLRYATVMQTTWLFRNYAQVAATALLTLREYCTPKIIGQIKWIPFGDAAAHSDQETKSRQKSGPFGFSIIDNPRSLVRGKNRIDFHGDDRSWKVLTLLVKRYPGYYPTVHLGHDAFNADNRDVDPSENVVQHDVGRLRSMLRPLGINVRFCRGQGYRLEEITSPRIRISKKKRRRSGR